MTLDAPARPRTGPGPTPDHPLHRAAGSDALIGARHTARFTAHRVGLVVALLLGLVGAIALARPAGAAEVGTTSATLRIGDDGTPLLTITNQGNAPCRVASTTIGTVTVLRAAEGDRAIAPQPWAVSFEDGLDRVIADGLQDLAPGASVDLTLRVVPVGPTGRSLETVAWSPASGALGALHPLPAAGRYDLEVRYELPAGLAEAGAAPACGAVTATTFATAAPPDREAAATAPVAPTDEGRRTLLLAVAIVAGAAALVLVVVILLLSRRSRRRAATPGGPTGDGATERPGGPGVPGPLAIVVVGLGAALTVGATGVAVAPRADAEIQVDPSLAGPWSECSGTLRGPGGDPAGILPALDGPGVTVHIVPAGGDQTHEGAAGRDIFIFWDPNDRHRYTGSGGNADPCTSLYHEMYHGSEDANGGQDHSPCVTAAGPSGLPVNEVNATRAQNELRRLLGMPERDTYGDTPLPTGPCLPPDQQPKDRRCSGNGCADSNGDPHLWTYDGRRYDFQAVGEFTASTDPAGGYTIQIRQEPFERSRLVAVNTAIAFDVAGDRVETDVSEDATVAVRVAGAPVTLTAGAPATALEHGGTLALTVGASSPIVRVTWPDGSEATISPIGRYGLHLTAQPAEARRGSLVGLLGDADGDPGNDLRPGAGADPLEAPGDALAGEPSFERLYPGYADAWRIDHGASLFTYPSGRTAGSYDDPTFPERAVDPGELLGREAAEQACRRTGVVEAGALASCMIDVALTGRPEFAVALRDTQAWLGALRIDGPEVTVPVGPPGDEARLDFEGDAGTKVFVDLPGTDLPSQCGAFSIVGPDGATLDRGCVIGGKGEIDALVLPTTGRYTFVVAAEHQGSGELRVRLRASHDRTGAARVDGPPVTLRVTEPGGTAELRFDAEAGTKLYVDLPSSTFDAECGLITLQGPDDATLGSGCIISGKGQIDATVLPTTGAYRLVLDPASDHTGEMTVRLVSAHDTDGTIAVDGPAVTARIEQPGAVARYTFTASAGDRVEVVADQVTDLPSECGLLRLVAPDGSTATSGCVIGDDGGIDPITLDQAGTYTLVVDPGEARQGSVRLRLRTAN